MRHSSKKDALCKGKAMVTQVQQIQDLVGRSSKAPKLHAPRLEIVFLVVKQLNPNHLPLQVQMPITEHLFWMPMKCHIISNHVLKRLVANAQVPVLYGPVQQRPLFEIMATPYGSTRCLQNFVGHTRCPLEMLMPYVCYIAELQHDFPGKQPKAW